MASERSPLAIAPHAPLVSGEEADGAAADGSPNRPQDVLPAALLVAGSRIGGGASLQAVARGRYHLCGDLDLAAVAGLARAGRLLATAAAAAPVEVDLGGVGRSSSAAVALLLEWTEQVRQRGGRLHFTNWPAALVRIAGLSNVDGLLGCDPGQQQAGPDQHGR